jgi:hypothetical protein
MIVKEASNKIFQMIKDEISKYRFRLNKTKMEFKRVENNCEQIFQLIFYKQDDAVFIRPLVRIKVKAIEDTYHKISKKHEQFNEDTTTLGGNLGEIMKYYETGTDSLSENMNTRYLIENEGDVEDLIKAIPERFKNYVLPYFKSNSSVKSVDELLNTEPSEMSIHNHLYPIRACIGIIAAKLNNNPDFDEIVQTYEENLTNANPDNKYEFLELKKILSKK